MVKILGPDGEPISPDVSGPIHITVQAGGIVNMGAASASTTAASSSAAPAAVSAPSVDKGTQYTPFADRVSDYRGRAGKILTTPRNRLLAGVAAAGIVAASAMAIFGRGESDQEARAGELTEQMITQNPLLGCDLENGNLAECVSEAVIDRTKLLEERLAEDPYLGCEDDSNVEGCLDERLRDIAEYGELAEFAQAVRDADRDRLGKAPVSEPSQLSELWPPAEPESVLINGEQSDALKALRVAASQNILFEHDSAELSAEGEEILREIGLATIGAFQAGQDVCLNVRGFASEPGTVDYNLDLSGDRTQVVSEFLIGSFNIPADNIHLATQNDLRGNIRAIHYGEQQRGGPENYDRIVIVGIDDGPCL